MTRVREHRDPNHRYWGSAAVVARYRNRSGLTPPEATFLRSVPGLPAARLLDIGVGGGRTAAAVAGRVAQYVGVDYAEPLIAACRHRFAGTALAGCFEVADARDLSAFGDASFDVALFGSNSIDYVDNAGRHRALAELRRVIRPDGWCGVSSHNLNNLARVLSVRERVERLRSDRPARRLPLALVRHLPLRMLSIVRNPPATALLSRPWVLLKDDGRLIRPTRTYYVAPPEMAVQVARAGFEVVDVMGPDGVSVPPDRRAAALQAWLFWVLRPVSPRSAS